MEEIKKEELLKYSEIEKRGGLFLHCAKCLKEIPKDESPQSYSSLEFSTYITDEKPKERIVVLWCKRHELQVWDSRHLVNR